MEDLAGLNFSGSSPSQSQPSNQTNNFKQNVNYLSPIPSRELMPNYNIVINKTNGAAKGPILRSSSSGSSPKPDSFASLSAFAGITRQGQISNLSLEQQRIVSEREKKEALEKDKRDLDLHFGDNDFWERHSRQGTPAIRPFDASNDVDLTAFSSDAPVNTETYFPPPKEDLVSMDAKGLQDPFHMSTFGESLSENRARYHHSTGYMEFSASSDDILGVLAQPVESFQKVKNASPKPEPPKRQSSAQSHERESSDDEDTEPRAKAIAVLVEMGFSVGEATKALSRTPSGIDVQAALDNLLSRPSSAAGARLEGPGARLTPDSRMRQRQEQEPPSQHKDISQIAGEVGTSLLKGAGNLWKSGREKMNNLIQEYQADNIQDPNVPKWMRNQQRHGAQAPKDNGGVTDEARILEAPNETRRLTRASAMERTPSSKAFSTKDRLRQQVEEEAEMGYRSPARQRVPSRIGTPSQKSSRTPTPILSEPNLLSNSSVYAEKPSHMQRPKVFKPPTPTPERKRPAPSVSDSALFTSHKFRQEGSKAFKAGDYSLALTHYSSALSPLPSSHPQRIVILSNRAITHLKLGDAKAAIADCDDMLSQIGPSRGEGETIEDMEGPKNLHDIWGKGILRRAQGLEAIEKYSDALQMWSVAVDFGVGGLQSIEAKRRCENAVGVKPSQPRSKTPVPTSLRPSSPANIPRPFKKTSTPSAFNSRPSATEALSDYNASVAAEENEKLRLYDTVDAKVAAWQAGKESNVRALLCSLDLILWPQAGWKKVNMAELVVPTKVKIIYMKAIAKVHPDKLAVGATVEQKMIAAAVFARLNDAFATFKDQNGL